MQKLISLILTLVVLISCGASSYADSTSNFEKFMAEWDENKELASQLLLKAEEEFKSGDELSACATQKEASEYGISATKSLIYAMEINGTKESLENLKAGVDKWKEIGDACGSIFN